MPITAFLRQAQARRREVGITTLVAQSAILFLSSRSSDLGGLTGLLMTCLLALPLVVKFDHHANLSSVFEKAIVVTGLGGLGMALGSAFYPGAPAASCNVFPHAQFFLSASTLLMILFCYIGCRLCARPG